MDEHFWCVWADLSPHSNARDKLPSHGIINKLRLLLEALETLPFLDGDHSAREHRAVLVHQETRCPPR